MFFQFLNYRQYPLLIFFNCHSTEEMFFHAPNILLIPVHRHYTCPAQSLVENYFTDLQSNIRHLYWTAKADIIGHKSQEKNNTFTGCWCLIICHFTLIYLSLTQNEYLCTFADVSNNSALKDKEGFCCLNLYCCVQSRHGYDAVCFCGGTNSDAKTFKGLAHTQQTVHGSGLILFI